MGERSKSPMQKNSQQRNYPTLEEVEHTDSFTVVGSAEWLPSKDYRMGVGGGRWIILQEKKPDTHFSQVTRWLMSTSIVIDYVNSIYPWYVIKKNNTLSSRSPEPIKSGEKQTNSNRGASYVPNRNHPENYQGYQNKERLRNCHSQTETWQPTPWMASWNRKRALGKNWGYLNKLQTLVNDYLSVLAR